MPPRHLPSMVVLFMATALLAMALIWQVPMMLWDHLNLVPLIDAWQNGRLMQSAFVSFDGGHLHALAYAVLLMTSKLTAGQPWLAIMISWALLVACACMGRVFIHDTFLPGQRNQVLLASLALFLLFYPGHLANLQWGWQVAVFLCLSGIMLALLSLTRPSLNWQHNLMALTGACIALLSFATAIAILPVALLVLALRHDCSRRQRLCNTLPWLALSALVTAAYLHFVSGDLAHALVPELLYTLNYLGSGIARFATDLAPLLAIAGLLVAAWAMAATPNDRSRLPWLGLVVFALLAALLTALGRAAEWGTDHAFVTRYVSFSSLFWLGLVGLLGPLWQQSRSRKLTATTVILAVFACANALHMIHQAQQVGQRTQTNTARIQKSWPAVSDQLLARIYFDKPDIARQRLGKLHDWGYAPFRPHQGPAVQSHPSEAAAPRETSPM